MPVLFSIQFNCVVVKFTVEEEIKLNECKRIYSLIFNWIISNTHFVWEFSCCTKRIFQSEKTTRASFWKKKLAQINSVLLKITLCYLKCHTINDGSCESKELLFKTLSTLYVVNMSNERHVSWKKYSPVRLCMGMYLSVYCVPHQKQKESSKQFHCVYRVCGCMVNGFCSVEGVCVCNNTTAERRVTFSKQIFQENTN